MNISNIRLGSPPFEITGARTFSKGVLNEDIATSAPVLITAYLATKTAAQDYNPSGAGYSCDLSYDGSFLAIGHDGTSAPAKLVTYKWSAVNSRYERTANPNTAPTGRPGAVAMSSDGAFLAVAHATAPYLSTYKWVEANNRYEITTAPDTLPTHTAVGCSMSSNGLFLAVSHLWTGYLITYKWVEANNRYEATTPPDKLPTTVAYGSSMSSDGTFLAVANNATSGTYAKLITYKWVEANDRYEVTTAASPLPSGHGRDCALSADGSRLIVAHLGTTTSPGFISYEWSEANNRYEQTAVADVSPNGGCMSCGMSSDGSLIVVGNLGTTPAVGLCSYVWSETNNRYEVTAPPDIAPNGGKSVAISGNGLKIASTQTLTPYMSTYILPTSETYTIYPLTNPHYDVTTQDTAFGYMMESGLTGETKKVKAVFWRTNRFQGDLD